MRCRALPLCDGMDLIKEGITTWSGVQTSEAGNRDGMDLIKEGITTGFVRPRAGLILLRTEWT